MIDDQDVRVARAMKKMLRGTGGGSFRSATPISRVTRPAAPNPPPPYIGADTCSLISGLAPDGIAFITTIDPNPIGLTETASPLASFDGLPAGTWTATLTVGSGTLSISTSGGGSTTDEGGNVWTLVSTGTGDEWQMSYDTDEPWSVEVCPA